jgi:hypothetical protein
MIAEQPNHSEFRFGLQADDPLHTPARVRATVDVVAEENERVLRRQLRYHARQQVVQRA